jgi:hypothetical protein
MFWGADVNHKKKKFDKKYIINICAHTHMRIELNTLVVRAGAASEVLSMAAAAHRVRDGKTALALVRDHDSKEQHVPAVGPRGHDSTQIRHSVEAAKGIARVRDSKAPVQMTARARSHAGDNHVKGRDRIDGEVNANGDTEAAEIPNDGGRNVRAGRRET